MIPEIGLMIGAYIITRMVASMPWPEKNATAAQLVVTIFASVTVLVSGFVVYDLFTRGSAEMPSLSQVMQTHAMGISTAAANMPRKAAYKEEASNILEETKALEWAYYQQYNRFDTSAAGVGLGLVMPTGMHWHPPLINGTAGNITITMTGAVLPLSDTDSMWVTLSADGSSTHGATF